MDLGPLMRMKDQLQEAMQAAERDIEDRQKQIKKELKVVRHEGEQLHTERRQLADERRSIEAQQADLDAKLAELGHIKAQIDPMGSKVSSAPRQSARPGGGVADDALAPAPPKSGGLMCCCAKPPADGELDLSSEMPKSVLLDNTAAIQVVGAGAARVNGAYIKEYDEFKMEEFELKYIPAGESPAGWYLCTSRSESYYYAPAAANQVPLVGWQTLDGVGADPAPTLKVLGD